jgi:mRNA-degrading endonuclease RelE of RelBE toxin-antitoxin system
MQDKTPLLKINESIDFKKNLKKLGKRYRLVREDIKPLIKQLEGGETPGDRISGNKYPVYKVRVKNSDTKKGQSGGDRILYYTITAEAILLTTIYSKSDRENISNEEIEEIIEQYELEVERQEGEKLIIPDSISQDIGKGKWLITIQPNSIDSIRAHNAFLNSYNPEDEGLYDDY